MSVKIIEVTSPAALWRHYDGQSERQPCHIELDLANGTLLADYNANIGSGVPATMYHGIDRWYRIPCLTAEAANRVMVEIAPLADRILADSEVEWDGNNHVGVLGEDGKAAEEELEEHLGLPTEGNLYAREPGQGFDVSDLVDIWDISGATNGCEVSEYDITADTTDERLDEIEAEILKDLSGPSGVTVCHGLSSYLRELRDDLVRERDED